MAFDPETTRRLAEKRAAMAPEERKLDALETIADQLRSINSELMSLNRNYQAAQRSR